MCSGSCGIAAGLHGEGGHAVKREMLNAKEDYHRAGLDVDDEAPGSRALPTSTAAATSADAEPAKEDIPKLIADLDQLRQQGAISEEEFQAKKTDLLARL